MADDDEVVPQTWKSSSIITKFILYLAFNKATGYVRLEKPDGPVCSMLVQSCMVEV